MSNSAYIATSLDGYIADQNGGLDWLHSLPNPDQSDFGFADFMSRVDALVMGRKTFETVCSFDGPWPYSKPVFVLSRSLAAIPEGYQDKAEWVEGSVHEVVLSLNERGYRNLYIDGGQTIQSFLKEDLIDEMIITTLPVLLGGGTPLFGGLVQPLDFEHRSTEVLLDAMVKSCYVRKRQPVTKVSQ